MAILGGGLSLRGMVAEHFFTKKTFSEKYGSYQNLKTLGISPRYIRMARDRLLNELRQVKGNHMAQKQAQAMISNLINDPYFKKARKEDDL
jgi:hypothetical protein